MQLLYLENKKPKNKPLILFLRLKFMFSKYVIGCERFRVLYLIDYLIAVKKILKIYNINIVGGLEMTRKPPEINV